MKSKAELQEQAQEYFKKFPKTNTLHATADGQFFFQKDRAELHAKASKLKVYSFQNDGNNDELEDNPLAELNAKDAISKIAEMEDVKELQGLAEIETRKTVKEAIEVKIKELTENQ